MTLDFQENDKFRAFIWNMENMDLQFSRSKFPITIKEWEDSYFFMAFKLNQSVKGARAPVESGTIRLEMRFKTPLQGTKKLLLLLEMEKYLVLDGKSAYIDI